MRLPVDKRWRYAKDWTPAERAQAKQINEHNERLDNFIRRGSITS